MLNSPERWPEPNAGWRYGIFTHTHIHALKAFGLQRIACAAGIAQFIVKIAKIILWIGTFILTITIFINAEGSYTHREGRTMNWNASSILTIESFILTEARNKKTPVYFI